MDIILGLYFLKLRPFKTFNSFPSTSIDKKSIFLVLIIEFLIILFSVSVLTLLIDFAPFPLDFVIVFFAALL